MKLNPKLQLRKVGDRYMIVDACSEEVNMTNIYSLNETAAFLWNKYQGKEFVPEDLANTLCEMYDVEKDVAIADVDQLIANWIKYDLILK